jgi:outer membrane receptor protein involved in Fe transport
LYALCLLGGCPLACVAADASSDSDDIPAQALSQALTEFAKQTGLQLIYVSQLVVDRRSQAVAAGESRPMALARLLEGTGLEYKFLNGRTVQIFKRPRKPGRPVLEMAAAEASGGNTLEEVVVTATKRDEPLSLVPMSIGLLSADQMQVQDVRNFSDIASRIPGLLFDLNSQYGPGVITNIAIRGISASSGEPTTGVYVDDVPIQASFNVFRNAYPINCDLDRVEVLRGPQGTLFGSNTPAGAVRFITKDASAVSFDQSYHLQVAGSQNGGLSSEIGAAVGGPLIEDRVGVRLSGCVDRDGGYIDRIDPLDGSHVDDNANRSSSKAARVGFVIQPTDSLSITPSFYYQSVYRHDTPAFYTYLSDPGDGNMLNGKLLRQPLTDKFTLTSLKIDESLGGFDLIGVSGYFDRESDAIVDLTNGACLEGYIICGSPLGPAYPTSYSQAIPTLLSHRQSEFTQELRLAYTNPEARLTGLIGVFYSSSHQNGLQDTYSVLDPSDAGIYSNTRFSSNEIAVFGQLRLALSPRWHIDAGTREGWRRGASFSDQGGFANGGPEGISQAISRFAALPSEPRVDVSFQPDGDNFFYAEIARGARAGGGNNVATCRGAATPAEFAQDDIWNYEIGAKNLLFDQRLRLAASVFFIRWNGIQESTADACGDGYTANAGMGTSKGFDLTLQAILSEHLRLEAALGMTDARYDRTVVTGTGQVVVDQGTAIGSLPSVPAPWNGTLTADYRRPLAPTIAGFLEADDNFATRNNGPFTENDPRSSSYSPGFRSDPSTNRLNVRIGIIRSGLKVGISLENALNSLPTLHLNSDVPGSTLTYAYTFQPRTVGLTVDWTPEAKIRQ